MTDLGTVRGQIVLDVRKAVAAYAAVRAQNARTVYALRGAGDSFVAAGKTMGTAGAVMVYAFAKVIQKAAEFERKMDFFSAVSDTSAESMGKLSDYTLQLAEDTIYSATQIADGLIELGKAGVSAEEIMGGIGDAMANLGAAGDIPLAESGQIITSTIQQFDLAVKDAVKVTDLLAGAANASIADITDIGVSLKYAGGVANAAGLSFEDTTTAISLLAKAGIRGSTAGTSLRQMMVSFGGATEPARDVLEQLGILTYDLADANKALAKITGGPAQKSVEDVLKVMGQYVESIGEGSVGTNKNAEAVKKLMIQYGGMNNLFYDSEGNLKSLSKVFQILQDSLKGYDNQQKLAMLRTLFNNRALSAASILTRDGAKGFRDMNKEMRKTTAADVASERLDNLSGDIEILQGNIETWMTKAGGPFQETMRVWVQRLTKLIQAFDKLDPSTQKMITQTVAISGVALVAMGAFSILVGTILRFIAAALKMAAGMKFVGKMIRIVLTNLKWLRVLMLGPIVAALGAVTLPVWILIGALVALVGGLVIAYKKFAPFRKAVHSIIDALQQAAIAVWKFLKLLVKDPGAAWEKTKKAFWQLVDTARQAISRIPGILKSWLNRGIAEVKAFGARVKQAFLNLMDRVINSVTSFVGRVIDLFTFKNIGYAIGWLIGTATRLFLTLMLKILGLVLKLVSGVIGFFASLPGKIGYLIGFLIGRAVGLFIKFAAKVIPLMARLVMGVIGWFAKLPGRIRAFLLSMVVKGIALAIRFARALPGLARKARDGMINWFKSLPAKIVGFIARMVVEVPKKLKIMKDKMVSFAGRMKDGFVDGIQSLPGKVGEIVDKMIQLVKDSATAAFNAVKDFAGGMWDGFKDGLGIHSPSYMEKAMWQITGVLDTETKKLAKKTMEVQKLSKKMAETQFGVGGGAFDTPKRQGYTALASMHERNQKRARTLQEGVGKRRDDARSIKTTNHKKVDVTVNNPKPERAGQSVSKVLKNKVEEAGWR